MKYGVQIDLRYTAEPSFDAAAEVDDVVAHLIDLEDCTPELLDSTVGMDMNAQTIEVEVTIEAATAGAALDLAVSVLRSAIHAAGGSTPGWEDEGANLGRIAFMIDESEGVHVRRLQLATA